MSKLVFKEKLPLKARIIGGFLTLFGLISWSQPDAFFTLIVLGIIILVFQINKEIHSDFQNIIKYKIGPIPVFSKKWKIIYPDYISLFKTNTSTKHEWGPVAAMGKESNNIKYHIRFFSKNEWVNIHTTTKKNEALRVGEQLKSLLQVELINKL